MISVWTALLIGIIAYYLYDFYRKVFELPPGPLPLPLLGNFWNELHPPYMVDDLRKLGKRFGGLFTVHLPFPVVNIASFDVLKRAYAKGEDFTGRIQSETMDRLIYCEKGGIGFSSGEMWREQRRVTMSILRDFGMGKNLMQEKIRDSVEAFVSHLRSRNDLDAIDLHTPIQLMVGNIINEFLFGFRHSFDNYEYFLTYVDGLDKMLMDINESAAFLLCVQYPWLGKLPFFREHGIDKHRRNMMKLFRYAEKEVERLESSYNEEDEPTNYTHAYMKKAKNGKFMTRDNLIQCCHDLFVAGQETTTTTLRWAMLFMGAHPEIQDKIRAEVHLVVGRDRLASMVDKISMPYTVASLHEIQRRANIIPVNFILMHRTSTDATIEGHPIPENTIIHVDIHQIHATDPHFVDPEEFCPERYLEEDGRTFKKEIVERTIPFGYGKRVCVGEGLARAELFICFTAILQNYRIMPVDGAKIDLDPIYSLAMIPKPQKLRLVSV